MNSSFIIKQEYFELVKKLNNSNKHKNQTTELYFFINSTNSNNLKLYAAISDTQKILLCEKLNSGHWLEAGFSEYPNLENYILHLLRTGDHHDNLTNYIKSHIFKLTS